MYSHFDLIDCRPTLKSKYETLLHCTSNSFLCTLLINISKIFNLYHDPPEIIISLFSHRQKGIIQKREHIVFELPPIDKWEEKVEQFSKAMPQQLTFHIVKSQLYYNKARNSQNSSPFKINTIKLISLHHQKCLQPPLPKNKRGDMSKLHRKIWTILTTYNAIPVTKYHT